MGEIRITLFHKNVGSTGKRLMSLSWNKSSENISDRTQMNKTIYDIRNEVTKQM